MPPQRRYFLGRGVHAIAVDGDVVFLDTAADRYLCLAAAEGADLHLYGRDGVIVTDPELLQGLLAEGLLSDRQGPVAARRVEPAPLRESAVRADTPAPTARDLAHIPPAVVDVLAHYRGRSFAQIVTRVGGHGAQAAKPPSAGLLAVVAQYHRWAPYAPLGGKCLLRSFVLLRLLRRRGHDAQWVFGVSTWPFRAHCWLQCGDVALDDDVERLAAFRPILVI